MARFILKLILCLLVALAQDSVTSRCDRAMRFTAFTNGSVRRDFKQYDKLILSVAAEHQLDPMLVKAVVWRESRFDRQKYGTAGERGLMQVSEKAANEWARDTRSTTSRSTNSSIQRQILRPVRGIWSAPSTIGRTNPSPCPSRLPNTTRSEPRSALGWSRWNHDQPVCRQLDFPGTRNMFNRFSIATLFTKSAAECESAFA